MNLNATLIAQIVVFLIFVFFTKKYVWPPITKAIDERAKKIEDGLSAADKAKADLALAEKRVGEELRKARESAADVRGTAEKQASGIIEDARVEATKIVADARKAAEAEAQAVVQRIREDLRGQVATLAIAGAEQILRREIDAKAHAELLANLKQELG